MAKARVECVSCHKMFWAKSKEGVALDNLCQMCKNRLRMRKRFKGGFNPILFVRKNRKELLGE